MFTPEDHLDAIDHDLGSLRRRLYDHDMTPPWRITDERLFVAERARLVQRIADLEHDREELREKLLAEKEWAA
jgi:hypothetical protein